MGKLPRKQMETMVRLKDVKTGEDVKLDLNNIDIFNPMEREWDVIQDSKNELSDYFTSEYKKTFNHVGGRNIDFLNIKKTYHPSIGTVNF